MYQTQMDMTCSILKENPVDDVTFVTFYYFVYFCKNSMCDSQTAEPPSGAELF